MIKSAVSGPGFWEKAHQISMRAWNANENKGLLAQTYAYSKKMAGVFLQTLIHFIEKAMDAEGVKLSEEEKNELGLFLDAVEVPQVNSTTSDL